MRLRCRVTIIAFCAITILTAPPVWAQTRDQNVDRCTGNNPDLKIAGCTALIQSGQESLLGLYVAYNNRGLAYDAKGLYDQAIADYTKLIALLPGDRGGYTLRGRSYEKKGQRDQAIADYRAALRLPDNAAATGPGPDYSRQALERLGVAP
jgi:tetratricopeptide (TPR) repeat protein